METEKTKQWRNDTELFDMMEERLYAAVISDALDAAGYREQALRHTIRPLNPTTVVVGRAMPVLCVDVYEIPDEPYQQEIAAVDSLKQDDVFVCSTNQSTRNCIWGELLSTAARARGARGQSLMDLSEMPARFWKWGFLCSPQDCRPLTPTDAVMWSPITSRLNVVVSRSPPAISCSVTQTESLLFQKPWKQK